jgi:hypothetical protein
LRDGAYVNPEDFFTERGLTFSHGHAPKPAQIVKELIWRCLTGTISLYELYKSDYVQEGILIKKFN